MFKKNRNCFRQCRLKIITRAFCGLLSIALLAASITPAGSEENEDVAIAAFYSKIILNPIVIDGDPYKEIQESSWFEFPKEAVCAIKYEDADRIHYVIKTFSDESAAERNGYIVTHKGHCGTCSTCRILRPISITGIWPLPFGGVLRWPGSGLGAFIALRSLASVPLAQKRGTTMQKIRRASACAPVLISGYIMSPLINLMGV